MIIFQTVEFAASFVEAMIGILISIKVLGEENIRIRDNIIASFIVAIVIWIINQYKIFSILATIFGVISIAACTCLIYKKKIFDSIILSIADLLLFYIIDFVSLSILGVITQNEDLANMAIEPFSGMRLCHIFLAKILLILIYCVFIKKIQSNIKIPIRKMLVVVIIGIAAIGYFVKRTFEQSINVEINLVWFLSLSLVLLGIYFANQYILYVREKDQIVMEMERSQLLAETYEKEIQDYQNSQIFFHDLENQYLIIKNYLDSKEYIKAEEYMEKLGFSNPAMPEQQTGIVVLDTLIEYKRKEAERNNIHVDMLLEQINLGLTEQECVALMGNLLDNAIDACKRMENDKRWIKLVIRKVKEMTFIKITNSYEEQPKASEIQCVSTHELHGFGMNSIKRIVDNYKGNMRVDCAMRKFTVVISFFN